MDGIDRFSRVGDRITAKRQTGERSADLLEYSRKVLAVLKDDVKHGVKVDPETIRSIERMISRHEPAKGPVEDLSRQIRAIKTFGRGPQQG